MFTSNVFQNCSWLHAVISHHWFVLFLMHCGLQHSFVQKSCTRGRQNRGNTIWYVALQHSHTMTLRYSPKLARATQSEQKIYTSSFRNVTLIASLLNSYWILNYWSALSDTEEIHGTWISFSWGISEYLSQVCQCLKIFMTPLSVK